MLVDVDVNTWLLLLNQVEALKLTGSKMVVYAVAYDAKICENLIAAGVPCYYEERWVKSLFSAYKKWTGVTIPQQEKLIIVQLGRMVATMIAVCENRNVFLSDGDVVFYRDPLDYVFDNVNIMITSTSIGPAPEWGAPYFADQPKQYYTLNNGVVYYRSNAVTKAFLLTLTVKCIAVLQKGPDLLAAFLQTTFHAFMLEHHLLVQPCSATSSPKTFKLQSNYTNKAGECYDCYYGEVSFTTNELRQPAKKQWLGVLPSSKGVVKTPATTEILRMGVFPMVRFTSLCSSPNATEYKKALTTSASALRSNDTSHWGWGGLGKGASRVLAVHANCILTVNEDYNTARFEKKIKWFRAMNSWFLP
eukprot:gene9436-11103_t